MPVRFSWLLAATVLAANAPLLAVAAEDHAPTGYTDTPQQPWSKWRVHDDTRPRPDVVKPGTYSSDPQPGMAPSDAKILFDGKSLEGWQAEKGGPAKWKVENGYMEVVKGAGDIVSKQKFSDCQLHVEFYEPTPPEGNSQERGNSGVFLAGLYEIQVLDSYDNKTYADGQASAVYGQTPPLVNAARPPGHWQTYDIIFNTPRFTNGKVSKAGYVTIFFNGVLTQNHTELLGPTVNRALPVWAPHEPDMPLKLQDHGVPVRYRNIWVRPIAPTPAG